MCYTFPFQEFALSRGAAAEKEGVDSWRKRNPSLPPSLPLDGGAHADGCDEALPLCCSAFIRESKADATPKAEMGSACLFLFPAILWHACRTHVEAGECGASLTSYTSA